MTKRVLISTVALSAALLPHQAISASFGSIADLKGNVETAKLKQRLVGAGENAMHSRTLFTDPEQIKQIAQAYKAAGEKIWGQDKQKFYQLDETKTFLGTFSDADGATMPAAIATKLEQVVTGQRAGHGD